jgi:hypothetical protein
MNDDEILELDDSALERSGPPGARQARQPGPRAQPSPRPTRTRPANQGEDEFWQIAE